VRQSRLQAGVAQLVEQLIRNQQVAGSSPIAGSNFLRKTSGFSPFSRSIVGLTTIEPIRPFNIRQPDY
jgi:hypothetical protein